MDLSPLPLALASALTAIAVTAIVALLLWRRAASSSERSRDEQAARIRELERRLHLVERDFLEQRNQLELAHAEALKNARVAAYEEGRQFGQGEANAARINELSEQRQSLLSKYEAERERSIAEAREKLRAEYELQTKLFTVKISPYVLVEEDRKFLGHRYRTATGYQYQLLVNGIPAFSPHVVAEQTEVKKVINPEVERLLLRTAEKAANAAIDAYLGGNSQFAKLAEPIIRRLPR
jgi:hypothetical protein